MCIIVSRCKLGQHLCSYLGMYFCIFPVLWLLLLFWVLVLSISGAKWEFLNHLCLFLHLFFGMWYFVIQDVGYTKNEYQGKVWHNFCLYFHILSILHTFYFSIGLCCLLLLQNITLRGEIWLFLYSFYAIQSFIVQGSTYIYHCITKKLWSALLTVSCLFVSCILFVVI